MKTKVVNKTTLSLAISFALFGMGSANADTVTCDDNGCKTTSFEFDNDGAGKSKLDLIIAPTNTNNNTTASGNTVTIKNTSKLFRQEARSVFGAYRDDDTKADNNKVVMSGGKVARDGGFGTFAYVVGAQSKGDVSNNTVTISDNAELARAWGNNYANIRLVGGKTKGGSGSATSNKVIINGGKINIEELLGGDSESSHANGNTVEINGGEVRIGGDADSNGVNMYNGMIAGGRAEKNRKNEKGDATNNTVKITGGIIEDFDSDISKVLGGHGYDVVSGNKVEITGGTTKADIYGGYSLYGEANDNKVTIKKGNNGNPTFGDDTIIGGFYKKDKNKYGGGSKSGKNNTLNLHTTGLKAKNIENFNKINFFVQPTTKVNDTFITLTDKPFKDEKKKIDHKANTDIRGTKIGVGVEGSSILKVGEKVNLIKKTNGQLLTDSDELPNVKGMQGIAVEYDFKIRKEDDKTLIAETIKIPDPNADKVTDVDFKIIYQADDSLEYGKTQVQQEGVKGSKNSTGIVKQPVNKIVKVGTKPTIKEEEIDFTTETKKLADKYTDFKEVKKGKKGKKTTEITYTLDPTTGTLTANEPKVTTTAPTAEVITIGTKPIGETVAFKTVYQADDKLEKGKKNVVTEGKVGKKEKGQLVEQPTNKVVKVGTKPTVTKEGNKTTTTTYKLDKDGNVIVDEVTVKVEKKAEPTTPVKPQPKPNTLTESAGRVHPQTRSLLESAAAGANFVNTGADFAVRQGMHHLTQTDDNEDGLHVFGTIGASDFLTETGSYNDVRGGHVLAGVGKKRPNKHGNMHAGAYFEGGKGRYNTHNRMPDNSVVSAHGDTKYVGIGALLQQKFNNNVIAEAGVRLGKTNTEYKSNSLRNSAGLTSVNYDVNRNYTGANIGLGYEKQIDDKFTAVPSAKLLYTQFNSAEKLIEGSVFNFNSIKSLRSQLGTDVYYKLDDKTNIYTNAFWEKEYQGDVDGTVLGLDMPAPTLKGDTGIVGIGVHYMPRENIDINMDFKGKFGKREGGEVGMSMKYKF